MKKKKVLLSIFCFCLPEKLEKKNPNAHLFSDHNKKNIHQKPAKFLKANTKLGQTSNAIYTMKMRFK